MAFNLQLFKTRALTSVVFVAVMLAGLLTTQWAFLALFTIIHFGCWVEYEKLIGLINPAYNKVSVIHKYAVMLAGWGFMLWMSTHVYRIGIFQLHDAGFWIFIVMFFIALVTYFVFNRQSIKLLGYSLLGLLYISLSWGLMINLRRTDIALSVDFGRIIVLILVCTIWVNDTMAYIVGSFIGKTPLSSISPKKTWEGTIGGALLAITTITLVCHFAVFLDYWITIVFTSIAVIAGTFGDLLESRLKRMANVKDSGHIMPGHGGFLDRFDSLLMATPFVWLFIYLLEYWG